MSCCTCVFPHEPLWLDCNYVHFTLHVSLHHAHVTVNCFEHQNLWSCLGFWTKLRPAQLSSRRRGEPAALCTTTRDITWIEVSRCLKETWADMSSLAVGRIRSSKNAMLENGTAKSAKLRVFASRQHPFNAEALTYFLELYVDTNVQCLPARVPQLLNWPPFRCKHGNFCV